MEIWCDSADIQTISAYSGLGIIQGITTNPALLAKIPLPKLAIIKQLLQIPDLPVAVQITGNTIELMFNQALELRALSPRIVIKVPVSAIGLRVIAPLVKRHIPVMATCVFEPSQCLLAASLGATYVAPYVSRIEKASQNALLQLNQMQQIIQNYEFKTRIIAASIHAPEIVAALACLKVAAVTLSPTCLEKWFATHPLTQSALDEFSALPII